MLRWNLKYFQKREIPLYAIVQWQRHFGWGLVDILKNVGWEELPTQFYGDEGRWSVQTPGASPKVFPKLARRGDLNTVVSSIQLGLRKTQEAYASSVGDNSVHRWIREPVRLEQWDGRRWRPAATIPVEDLGCSDSI